MQQQNQQMPHIQISFSHLLHLSSSFFPFHSPPPLLFGELVYQHNIGNEGINPLDPVFRLSWAIYHMVLCAPFKRGHGEVLVLLLSVPNQILKISTYFPSPLWNNWGKGLWKSMGRVRGKLQNIFDVVYCRIFLKGSSLPLNE